MSSPDDAISPDLSALFSVDLLGLGSAGLLALISGIRGEVEVGERCCWKHGGSVGSEQMTESGITIHT